MEKLDKRHRVLILALMFLVSVLIVSLISLSTAYDQRTKLIKLLESKLTETEALLYEARSEAAEAKTAANDGYTPTYVLVEPAEDYTEDATEESAPVIPELATDRDIELIARVMWGEATIVKSSAERAAVAWCILNRVDESGDSIEDTALAPAQFVCREGDEIPAWALELAEDVVGRWEREHAGEENVGRTLPIEYRHFIGDGRRNYFSIEWKSKDYWDWSLPDPYAKEDTK